MKKSLKIVGSLLLATAVGSLVYRYYQKEFKKLRAQEDRARKDVESAGMSYDKLQEEVTNVDDLEGNTFIKSVATGLYFNENVLLDYLDLDSALRSEGGIIHIMEQSFNNRQCLDFLFELPNYVKGPYSGINRPRINEYIKTIKSMAEMVNDEIIKGPRPVIKPELYAGIRYIWRDDQSLEKDSESSFYMIPQAAYAEYADENHDGLNNFYTDMVVNDKIHSKEFKDLLIANEVVNFSDPNHFEVVDLCVMIKVSYRIATTGGGAGITFLQVPRVACRFAEDLSVTSAKGGKYGKGVTFEHILIHPRLEDQEEFGELPCTVYENINGVLEKSDYVL